MSKVSFVSCWMVNNYRARIQRLFLLICELNVDMAIWHVWNNITHGGDQDHTTFIYFQVMYWEELCDVTYLAQRQLL